MPTMHLLVKGKVQGVFYRATAKKKADEYGITGWVQNTPDGAVEMVANGPTENLDKFIDWCYEGPSKAKVTDVIKKEQKEEFFTEFTVRR